MLFGIYLKESDAVRVVDNRISGKDRPLGVRGDGIRLWYSHDGVVEGNSVDRTRDVVVYFSRGLTFSHNRVSNGRYGLHYMYSDHNVFEHNEFVDNNVAAFLMYSTDIVMVRNVFARASGRSGFGIGLKDADHIEVLDNLIVQNQVGIYLDNSPYSVDVRNRFERNILAFNDIAIVPLPSVHSNDFIDNSFSGNIRDVTVSGGGTALANRWWGNRWDGAQPWDEDGDGFGDFPYRVDRLSDDLIARHPELRLYELSPAAAAVDALGRFFPLLKPRPLVVDSMPRLAFKAVSGPDQSPDQGVGSESFPYGLGPADSGSRSRSSPWAAVLWLGMLGLSIWGAWRWPL